MFTRHPFCDADARRQTKHDNRYFHQPQPTTPFISLLQHAEKRNPNYMYAVSNWTSVIASSTTINREAKTNKEYGHKKNYPGKKKKRTTSAVGTGAIRNECERRCLNVAFLRRLPSLTGNARKMMRWICSLGISVLRYTATFVPFKNNHAYILLHAENISDHGPKLF